MTFDSLPPLSRFANDVETEQWFDSVRERLNFFLTGKEVKGSIRFDTTTSKHQGYDGTTWNDLY